MEIAKNKSGIEFSGSNSEINNYLMKWDAYYNSLYTLNYNEYYSQSPEQFIKYTQGILDKLMEHYQKLKDENTDVNKDFSYLEENRLKYVVYTDWNNYISFMNNEVPEHMKKEFYSYLNNTELNNAKLLGVSEYVSFLQSYVELKRQQYLRQNPVLIAKYIDI